MATSSAFLQFWLTDNARHCFLSHLPSNDLSSLRLACHDFGVRAAPLLFEDLNITFRPSTLTKPARMAALDRIGHHVRTLNFHMPHGSETFLPPLLDPVTGEELTFVYEPSCPSPRNPGPRLGSPTYGSWEMTDVLVKQYPPLFHAAANVPAFIRAFSAIPNLQHLRIACPGQEPAHRYRRSIVDYALISIRIAVERSPLTVLSALSLSPIHPSAVLYLRPAIGLGALPSSTKRWRQIRQLTVHMDAIPATPGLPTDHLKLLHAYLQTFALHLSALTFRWTGAKGPFPLALGSEPALLANTSPPLACPRRCHLALRPLRFPRLRFMEVENALLDACQVAAFITAHRRKIGEFRFEDSMLRTGDWDEALAPLTRISGSKRWKEKSEEVMDVPLMLSPVGIERGQMDRVVRECLGGRGCGRVGRERSGGWREGVGRRGKGLLSGTEEHMRKFLRSSVFTWL